MQDFQLQLSLTEVFLFILYLFETKHAIRIRHFFKAQSFTKIWTFENNQPHRQLPQHILIAKFIYHNTLPITRQVNMSPRKTRFDKRRTFSYRFRGKKELFHRDITFTDTNLRRLSIRLFSQQVEWKEFSRKDPLLRYCRVCTVCDFPEFFASIFRRRIRVYHPHNQKVSIFRWVSVLWCTILNSAKSICLFI